MDKLIITVTVDSTMSYPGNPHCPKSSETKAVAAEYIRSVEAGASIAHTHGSYTSDPRIQADGRKLQLPSLDGTCEIIETVRSRGAPIIQMGLASMRFEQKVQVWKRARPEMNSTAFNAHDEYFQPDPSYPPFEIYSVHPVDELRQYARAANEHNVKLEIESFHTGAFWMMQKVRSEGLLPEPVWTTLFLGWPGGSWTPPTPQALQYLVSNLPARTNWNLSCMTPSVYWPVIGHAIAMGGHVRVGMEDCPYLEDGNLAKSNARWVAKAVRLARELCRAVATPEEARKIIGPPISK